jgi:hypothetical protein
MVRTAGRGLAATLALCLCCAFTATTAAADTASFTQAGCSNWTVPNGVSTVGIVAIGAPGASGSGSNPASGGPGADVSATAPATHGQEWEVCVNSGGGRATSGGGGAGGGASGVSGASDFSDPLVVAGGGGGGGAPGTLSGAGGPGGAGGAQSGSGSPSTKAGPGVGANGSGGGGAGGGGYVGGGAGTAAGLTAGGAGGGGGTNFCSPSLSRCASQTAQTATSEVILFYVVSPPPTTAIATPANGAVYGLGQSVATSFTCAEGNGGPGVTSCTDQNGRSSGAAVDTSTVGAHTLTVTALSGDGLSSSSSVTYTVASTPSSSAPRVSLAVPSNGATYSLGQVVNSNFQCTEGPNGPGLKSCVDQNGRTSGAAVDTSTPGNHTYTVTATSQDGLTASASATYRVIPPPSVAQVQAQRGGVVTMQVAVSGPGTIEAIAVAGFKSFALAAHAARAADVQPPPGSFVFGRGQATATTAQTLSIRTTVTQAGKLLLRDHRRAAITVMVFYTATGAIPQLVKSQALSVSR